MKDGDDVEAIASQAIRNHVGRTGNDELVSTRYSAWTTKIRQPGQTVDGGQEHHGDAAGRIGVIARDVGTKVSKVADRAWRPDSGHARGAFRSPFLPHERSQVDTCL